MSGPYYTPFTDEGAASHLKMHERVIELQTLAQAAADKANAEHMDEIRRMHPEIGEREFEVSCQGWRFVDKVSISGRQPDWAAELEARRKVK